MKKVLIFFVLTIVLSLCLTACGKQTQHIHKFEEWSITKFPTCFEMGEKARYCYCGEYQKETIPITDDHIAIILPAIESTCKNTGLSEGKKCSDCDKILIAQQEIPIKAHTEEILPSIEATCTTIGLSEGKKCSVCGDILIPQQETPVVAHTYDDKYDETCNKCGFVRDAECAHREIDIIKGCEATCSSIGFTNGSKCIKCGEIIIAQEVIPVKSHIEVIDKAVEATCINTGLTEGKHCSVCNVIILAQEVVPLKAHSEVIDKAIEATCTSTGLTEGKHCSVCNSVIVLQETVSALGHDTVDHEAKSPTCTEIGWSNFETCTRCDYTSYVEKLPFGHTWTDSCDTTCNECGEMREAFHNYSSVTTAPTCTTKGYTTYVCSCGNTYIDDYVELVDHTWTNSCDTTCDKCGTTREVAHSYGDWSTIKEPTNLNTGSRRRACNSCGYIQTETIEKITNVKANVTINNDDRLSSYFNKVPYVSSVLITKNGNSYDIAVTISWNISRFILVSYSAYMKGGYSYSGHLDAYTGAGSKTFKFSDVPVGTHNISIGIYPG